jgi:hypothetical protein
MEELHAEVRLELPDRLGQWGLSHMEPRGRPAEVALFAYRDEVAQMAKLHVTALLPTETSLISIMCDNDTSRYQAFTVPWGV